MMSGVAAKTHASGPERLARALAVMIGPALGVLLVSRPATVAACKPPQFVAERLEFELVGARRGGQPVPLDGLPARVYAYSDPYVGMLVEELGWMKRIEATAPLPRSTERYLRRQRRRAKIICAILVHHEPMVPGHYVPHHEPDDLDRHGPRWAALWPTGTPGSVEFAATREQLHMRIEGPGASLELEYRLTRATFSSCDVTANGSPSGVAGVLVGVVALGLRRRRRR